MKHNTQTEHQFYSEVTNMKYILVELQNRPDGITNKSINSYSSFSVGLATFYQRASVAVTSKDFTSVVLTLMSAEGDIVEHKRFDTEYAG